MLVLLGSLALAMPPSAHSSLAYTDNDGDGIVALGDQCPAEGSPSACYEAALLQMAWLDVTGPQWQRVHPNLVVACAGGVAEACPQVAVWEPASRGYWPLPE